LQSFFRLISHVSETSIFLILGLSVVKTFKTADVHWGGFFMWTCVACLLARAFNIYSLSYLYNISHRGSSERLFGEEMERRKTTGSVGGGLDKLCAAKGEGTDAEKEEEKKFEPREVRGGGDNKVILEGDEESDEEEEGRKTFTPRGSDFLGESMGSRGSYSFGYGSGQVRQSGRLERSDSNTLLNLTPKIFFRSSPSLRSADGFHPSQHPPHPPKNSAHGGVLRPPWSGSFLLRQQLPRRKQQQGYHRTDNNARCTNQRVRSRRHNRRHAEVPQD